VTNSSVRLSVYPELAGAAIRLMLGRLPNLHYARSMPTELSDQDILLPLTNAAVKQEGEALRE
jgi:hypothetical protein